MKETDSSKALALSIEAIVFIVRSMDLCWYLNKVVKENN